MNDYNKAQIDYRDGCKKRIKRQMEISKMPSITHHHHTSFPIALTRLIVFLLSILSYIARSECVECACVCIVLH